MRHAPRPTPTPTLTAVTSEPVELGLASVVACKVLVIVVTDVEFEGEEVELMVGSTSWPTSSWNLLMQQSDPSSLQHQRSFPLVVQGMSHIPGFDFIAVTIESGGDQYGIILNPLGSTMLSRGHSLVGHI